MPDDEAISGTGQTSFLVRRGVGPPEIVVNSVSYEVAETVVVSIGDLERSGLERVESDRPDVVRFFRDQELAKLRHRHRNTVHPAPKPRHRRTPRRPPRSDPSVPCPLCRGRDEFCVLCDGDGTVTARRAREWSAG